MMKWKIGVCDSLTYGCFMKNISVYKGYNIQEMFRFPLKLLQQNNIDMKRNMMIMMLMKF